MNEKQKKLLEILKSYLGASYKWGAKPEDVPNYFDCSSLTLHAFQELKRFGFLDRNLDNTNNRIRISLRQAAYVGIEIPLDSKLEIGDLLFFRGSTGKYDDKLFPGRKIHIGHVAIYIGDNKVIHATSRQGVNENNLENVIKSHGPIVMAKRVL